MLRGFATLGQVHQPIANPRGYLVRIATRLWIDALRRRDTEARRAPEWPAPAAARAPDRASEAREAAGAVKAALHRARERTGAALEAPSARRAPSAALVDRFVERSEPRTCPASSR